MNINELREKISGMVAEPNSDEGQEEIHSGGTHVTELWEDGEVTITKSGKLYRRRSIHQVQPPIAMGQSLLWDVPEGQKHKRMVVINEEATQLVKEFRESCLYWKLSVDMGIAQTLNEESAKEELRFTFKHHDREEILDWLCRHIEEE